MKLKQYTRMWLFLVCCSMPQHLLAEDAGQVDAAQQAMPASTMNDKNQPGQPWYNKTRDFVSGRVQNFSSAVDNWLSFNFRNQKLENESYLKIELATVFEEGGNFYNKSGLSMKVDLPKTQKRWSLVFETDPEEFESLEEQNSNLSQNDGDIGDNEDGIGAVRFVMERWHNWDGDADVGVKASTPLNPFVRFEFRRNFKLPDRWRVRIKNSFYYFHIDGFGEQTEIDFSRPIAENWFFNNLLEMKWKTKGSVLEFGDVVSFLHRYSDRSVYRYQTGYFYQEHPEQKTLSYFVQVQYRRRIYQDWVFLDLVPNVTWSESSDFKDETSFKIQLEVLFK